MKYDDKTNAKDDADVSDIEALFQCYFWILFQNIPKVVSSGVSTNRILFHQMNIRSGSFMSGVLRVAS